MRPFDFQFSDIENKEFGRVVELINLGKNLIAVYGEAGTGKSTFIQQLTAYGKKRTFNVQCLAFTGRAAGNISGRTIHSFFGFELRPYLPTEKIFELSTKDQLVEQGVELSGTKTNPDGKEVQFWKAYMDMFIRFPKATLKELDILIIDEISMVRCDLLDACNIVLRKVRGNDTPFGGVVVLLVGDKRQLPPVATSSDRVILEDYYASPFSYLESDVIRNSDMEEVVLDRVYRQKDQGFVRLLRGIRLNGLMPADIETLNKRLQPNVQFERITVEDQIICSTNGRVDHYNSKMLELVNSQEFVYHADLSPGYPRDQITTNLELKLKLGAKVVFLRNDKHQRYYTGSIGQVRALFDDRVVVEVNGAEVDVKRQKWTSNSYRHDRERRSVKRVGTSEWFVQMPLRLAWAMTTYKAQGQTFDRILCDLSDEFLPENTYVTLSRCRSLEGVTLLAPLEMKRTKKAKK